MKLTTIIHRPEAQVVFTKGDIELLKNAARHHYDTTCKLSVNEGGLLHRISTIMDNAGEDYEHGLTFRELDFLTKVAEVCPNEKTAGAQNMLKVRLATTRTTINHSTHAPTEFPRRDHQPQAQ